MENNYDIGFACTTIFHYVHMSRIYEHFGSRALFIIATPRYTNQRFERLQEFFKKNNIEYCDTNDIINRKVNVKLIIAPYFIPLFNFIDPSILRVRILYGYAKDAWNYADWNKGFDLILSYGPYSENRLKKFAPTVSIGHPRYRIRERVETRSITDIRGNLLSEWLASSNLKTIIYSPTWGDLSSLAWFQKAIEELTSEYKVIIKLHHGIVLSNGFNSNNFKHDRLFVCDETIDLFDLFPFGEAVISDYSGAIFDAILVEKKIVLVNSLEEEVVDTGVLNIKIMSNIASLNDLNSSGEESLDIQVRRFLLNTNDPKKLVPVVNLVLNEQMPTKKYRELNSKLYSYFDDDAPLRAFEEIDKLLSHYDNSRNQTRAHTLFLDKKKLQKFIENHTDEEFIIWGAGDYGQLLTSWLLSQGLKIKAILDVSDSKQGKYLFGIPIYSPSNYKLNEEKIIVSFLVKDTSSVIYEVFPNIDKLNFVVPFH